MNRYTSLMFSTPDQGEIFKGFKRVYNSRFGWPVWQWGRNNLPDLPEVCDETDLYDKDLIWLPAYTLQELRDIAKLEGLADGESRDQFKYRLEHSTAKELADWIIAKLKERS